jgi:hypothetical protein
MHDGLNTATRIHLNDAKSDNATSYLDPLDPDTVQDLPLVVTRRQLIRLAVVSTEVGARFQREAIDHDCMAWMLAPRMLFDGRDAIEASLEQRHCIRALVLHGLGLGLDAHPSDIDDLMSDGAKGGRNRRDRSPRTKRKATPCAARNRRYANAG